METTLLPNSTELMEELAAAEDLVDSGGVLYRLIVHIIVFVFGVLGNCLILRVYWAKPLTTSTHALIMGLAWADLFVCLTMANDIAIYALIVAGRQISQVLLIIWPFQNTAIGTSVMITAVIAADRYDCVCRPHKRFFTHRRAKVAARAALLFSCVLNIPAFIALSEAGNRDLLYLLILAFQMICFVTALVMIAVCYGKVYATIRKHVKVGVVSTSQAKNYPRLDSEWSTRMPSSAPKTAQANISVVAESTLVDYPSSGLTTQTKNLKKINDGAPSSHLIPNSSEDKNAEVFTKPEETAERLGSPSETNQCAQSKNRSSSKEPTNGAGCFKKPNAAVLQRKTTRMLFITSLIFLLTWLPYWVDIALKFASYGGANIHPVVSKIVFYLHLLLFVNNAVNPLIYGLANRRFRKDCWEVIRKIRTC